WFLRNFLPPPPIVRLMSILPRELTHKAPQSSGEYPGRPCSKIALSPEWPVESRTVPCVRRLARDPIVNGPLQDREHFVNLFEKADEQPELSRLSGAAALFNLPRRKRWP